MMMTIMMSKNRERRREEGGTKGVEMLEISRQKERDGEGQDASMRQAHTKASPQNNRVISRVYSPFSPTLISSFAATSTFSSSAFLAFLALSASFCALSASFSICIMAATSSSSR